MSAESSQLGCRSGITNAIVFALLILCVPHAQGQRADTVIREIGAPVHRGISSLVENLSIGVLEGPAEYTFVEIWDVALGKNGEMLILDSGPRAAIFDARPTLRLFDGNGRFLRNVGGRGKGPGEYIMPSSVAAIPDGGFLLYDGRNHRMTVYSRAGIYEWSWGIGAYNVLMGAPAALRIDPDGIVTITFRRGGSADADRAVLRMRMDGAIVDTLNAPELPDVELKVNKGRSRLTVPYSPRALWARSPHGSYVTAVNTRYVLDLRVAPRPTPQAQTRPWRPGDGIVSLRGRCNRTPVSSAERSDQKAYLASLLRNIRGQQSGQVPGIPSVKPRIRRLTVADDGRLWVWIHTASERYNPPAVEKAAVQQIRWREPALVDVFEPDGVYLGRVRIPYNLYPLRFRGDEIWGYSLDETNVPYVKRYRVKWNTK